MFDIKNARDLFAFTTGAQADVAREAFDEIESLRAERQLLVAVAESFGAWSDWDWTSNSVDVETMGDNFLDEISNKAKDLRSECIAALTAWRER